MIMDGEGERIRIVVMGDNKVGKTAILRKFLNNTFKSQYKATVEDLYSQDFQIGESTLKVDFLDTSGDDQFPVMRRLSISSGHAFLLVYSITCPDSLLTVHARLEEIKSQRNDFKDVPIIIAGNKEDLGDTKREVYVEDVVDWVQQDYKLNRINVLECSALNSYNIVGLFKSFLYLSKIDLAVLSSYPERQEDKKLHRGKSAYARIKQISFKKKEVEKSPKLSFKNHHQNGPNGPASPLSFRRSRTPDPIPAPFRSSPLASPWSTSRSGSGSEPEQSASSSSSPAAATLAARDTRIFRFDTQAVDMNSGSEYGNVGNTRGQKAKVRSRSLIRRSSKKVKQRINEVNGAENCVIN